MESRALARVTAFTDAAVAIALTLLVLPLVDVAKEAAGTPVFTLLGRHDDDLLAFVLSFFVVVVFWRAHRRIFERVVRLDEPLLTLNVLWLLGVVFLPVPTAVLTFEGEGEDTATVLYLANLLFVAMMGLALTGWLRLRPGLREPGTEALARQQLRRGLLVCGGLAAITVLALPLGSGALLLLAGLPVGRAVLERIAHRRAATRPGPKPAG
jgi:uncharacterized membrane protein